MLWFKDKQIKNTQMIQSSEGVQLLRQQGALALWARFYDVEQQQPLFVDRDCTVVSSMDLLSVERQHGDGWYQSNANFVLKAYPLWKARRGSGIFSGAI